MNDVREELEFLLAVYDHKDDEWWNALKSALNAMLKLSDRELESTAKRASRTADSFREHARSVGLDHGGRYLLGMSAAFSKLHRIYENYIRRTFL